MHLKPAEFESATPSALIDTTKLSTATLLMMLFLVCPDSANPNPEHIEDAVLSELVKRGVYEKRGNADAALCAKILEKQRVKIDPTFLVYEVNRNTLDADTCEMIRAHICVGPNLASAERSFCTQLLLPRPRRQIRYHQLAKL
jgi:hypothetical protein